MLVVIAELACPSWRATTGAGTPAGSIELAAVWRRPWNVTRGAVESPDQPSRPAPPLHPLRDVERVVSGARAALAGQRRRSRRRRARARRPPHGRAARAPRRARPSSRRAELAGPRALDDVAAPDRAPNVEPARRELDVAPADAADLARNGGRARRRAGGRPPRATSTQAASRSSSCSRHEDALDRGEVGRAGAPGRGHGYKGSSSARRARHRPEHMTLSAASALRVACGLEPVSSSRATHRSTTGRESRSSGSAPRRGSLADR